MTSLLPPPLLCKALLTPMLLADFTSPNFTPQDRIHLPWWLASSSSEGKQVSSLKQFVARMQQELKEHVSKEGRQVIEQYLLQQLENMLHSVDEFHTGLMELENVITEPAVPSAMVARSDIAYIDRHEALGILVRKVTLIAKIGSFELLVRCYEATRAFVSTTHDNDNNEQAHVTTTSPLLTTTIPMEDDDHVQSIDALHAYYDTQPRRTISALPPLDPARIALSKTGYPSRSASTFLQRAILDLASLHLHLEHYAAADLAAKEAVSIAQQQGDEQCLSSALNLLHHVSGGGGPRDPNDEDMTRQLLTSHTFNPSQFWEKLSTITNEEQEHQVRMEAWRILGHSSLSLSFAKLLTENGMFNHKQEDMSQLICHLILARCLVGKDMDRFLPSKPTNNNSNTRVAPHAALSHLSNLCHSHPSLFSSSLSRNTMHDLSLFLLHRLAVGINDLGLAEAARGIVMDQHSTMQHVLIMDELLPCGISSITAARCEALQLLLVAAPPNVDAIQTALTKSRIFRREHSLLYALKAYALSAHCRTAQAIAALRVCDALLQCNCTKDIMDRAYAEMLEPATHHLLAHDTLLNQGEALLLSAKFHLYLREEEKSIQFLQAASAKFKEAPHVNLLVETLYLLARVLDACNHATECNVVAEAFLKATTMSRMKTPLNNPLMWTKAATCASDVEERARLETWLLGGVTHDYS